MKNKVNIYNEEWCELIFENKNHDYGAYQLRLGSNKRHLVAFIVAVSILLLLIGSPYIFASVLPDDKGDDFGIVEMTDIEFEPETNNADEAVKEVVVPEANLASAIAYTTPEIVPDEVFDETKEMKPQEQINDFDGMISSIDFISKDNGGDIDPAILNVRKEITDTKEVDETVLYADQMPMYEGGLEEMYAFIAENIKYPVLAREENISGTVHLSFIVRKNGKITDIKILRPIGGGCEEEAVRVIEKMPNWRPGRTNGTPISVQFTIPIKFTLE
ncbi:MAG: TonB family protein [Bacteroidota bacterium]